MGGTLSKLWNLPGQGYYCDMVDGYISRAAGSPCMIRFPQALRSLPANCPHCSSNSGLLIEEMQQRLETERQKFQTHVDQIIATRFAAGERHPYFRNNNNKAEGDQELSGKRHLLDPLGLLGYIKRNVVVSPEPDANKNVDADPFDFPVKVDNLVVCRCMKIKYGGDGADIVLAEEDEELGVETSTMSKQKGNLKEDKHTGEDREIDGKKEIAHKS